MDASETVAELRRNDPNRKLVEVRLGWQEQEDIALSLELERNNYINEIRFLSDSPEQQHHWDNLVRVLATREKLERVHFVGDRFIDGRFHPIVQHAMILQAVQRNPFVHTVGFDNFDLASGELVSSFLDNATSLTLFKLACCAMNTQAAGRIAASLQRHTNLQKLSLSELQDSPFTLILQGLETNSCLQSLELNVGDPIITREAAPAIEQLLDRTTSIRCLELKNFMFTEESFRPICQALIRSTTVSEVQFGFCFFADLASMDLFGQMIETKPNLQSLGMEICSFLATAYQLLRDSLSAVLLRPNSPLRSFELIQFDLSSIFPGPTFGALLIAVGRGTLKRFSIGFIYSEVQFQTLRRSLPVMKIQDLVFELRERELGRDGGNRKQALLEAAKRNFSLRSLKGTFVDDDDDRPFFTNDDNIRLQFYFDRNERLAQWVASPATVPRLLWPDALGLALKAGETSLYRSLQAVLGDEIGSMQGKRKRKRTSFYEPS